MKCMKKIEPMGGYNQLTVRGPNTEDTTEA